MNKIITCIRCLATVDLECLFSFSKGEEGTYGGLAKLFLVKWKAKKSKINCS